MNKVELKAHLTRYEANSKRRQWRSHTDDRLYDIEAMKDAHLSNTLRLIERCGCENVGTAYRWLKQEAEDRKLDHTTIIVDKNSACEIGVHVTGISVIKDGVEVCVVKWDVIETARRKFTDEG